MSFLSTILSWFGIGRKPKPDKRLPPPIPGSGGMNITTDSKDRSTEAERVLRAYIRPPYQITDRTIRIETVSFDEGRKYFKAYGWNPDHWKANREGTFYAPKPPFQDGGLIQLVDKKLDQQRRVFLTVHEYGHCCWHWLLLDSEWLTWRSQNRDPEMFADAFADRMLGKRLSDSDERFFDALESRLSEGNGAQRG